MQGVARQSNCCIAQLMSSEVVNWKIATDSSDSRQYVANRTFVGASNGLRGMLNMKLMGWDDSQPGACMHLRGIGQ
jgi:hypothetical protein